MAVALGDLAVVAIDRADADHKEDKLKKGSEPFSEISQKGSDPFLNKLRSLAGC